MEGSAYCCRAPPWQQATSLLPANAVARELGCHWGWLSLPNQLLFTQSFAHACRSYKQLDLMLAQAFVRDALSTPDVLLSLGFSTLQHPWPQSASAKCSI